MAQGFRASVFLGAIVAEVWGFVGGLRFFGFRGVLQLKECFQQSFSGWV